MFDEVFLCASTVDAADLHERIGAAASAGYDGFGLRPGRVARAVKDGLSVGEISAEIAVHGLELFEIGFLSDWWLPDGENAKSRSHEESLYRLKDHLGGRHMMVIGGPLDQGIDRVAERFAGVCRRAAAHGLTVALEFLPWTDTRTIADAWQIVEASGEPNGGVVMDTWHFFRGGSTFEQLAAVPANRIPVIQLSDGPLVPVGSELDDTFHLRQMPGDGEFDLDGLFERLSAMGVTAPIGVEILSDDLRAHDVSSVASATRASVSAFLARQRHTVAH